MANCEGLIIMVDTQLNMYAEKGPNATMKYEYSAPEEGIMVPSSAQASAPEIENG